MRETMARRNYGTNVVFLGHSAALCLALVVVVVVVSIDLKSTGAECFKLSKLFDFEHYKTTFKKHYSGVAEAARKTYFYGRAVRAYLSGVQFRLRLREDYLSLNHMSDHSLEEIELMKNPMAVTPLKGDQRQQETDEGEDEDSEIDDGSSLPELMPREGEDVEQEIVELINEHRNEPEYADLREHIDHDDSSGPSELSRKKRFADPIAESNNAASDEKVAADDDHDDDVDEAKEEEEKEKEKEKEQEEEEQEERFEPREMPNLINTGSTQPIRRRRINNFFRAFNENFEPPVELTRGLKDQIQRVKVEAPKPEDERSIKEQMSKALAAANAKKGGAVAKGAKGKLPDEVFVDHRESGCFVLPRRQGLCRSCYAFVIVALMEFLLCKQYGQMVTFSEQYIINCGKGRFIDRVRNKVTGKMELVDRLKGCNGGDPLGAVNFVYNFGVERRQTRTYADEEQKCHLEENGNLKKTGEYRWDHLGTVKEVPIEHIERQIKKGPLYVQARTGKGFEEWGGGIDFGRECVLKGNHGMLLVGHGRENGHEYWILRNSYYHTWGEGGYWKLWKGATSKCLEPKAYLYGFDRGVKRDHATMQGPNKTGPTQGPSKKAKVSQAKKARKK